MFFRLPFATIDAAIIRLNHYIENESSLPVKITLRKSLDFLDVKITKWGTSSMTFVCEYDPEAKTLSFNLLHKTIAFMHRPYWKKIENAIGEMVQKVGGTIGV